MKKTVLFIDSCCYKPYSLQTLQTQALGGTEATVIRIAEGLKTNGYIVKLEQPFINPLSRVMSKDNSLFDTVICLRDPRTMIKARERFPKAKIYLWSHDLCTQTLGQMLPIFEQVKCSGNIIVSNFHKIQTVETLKPFGYTGQFKTIVIHNPIDNDLKPDSTPVDKNKLAWISSPHKGLDYALEIFNSLLEFNREFTFHIANPGYVANSGTKIDKAVFLGPLSHSETTTLLRSSLCLFYPNKVFPETFGLVFGEANAVGTPVLTHDFGAAREVLDKHPDQVIDCRNKKKIIDMVMKWYTDGRPTVRCRPEFRLNSVIRKWVELLGV